MKTNSIWLSLTFAGTLALCPLALAETDAFVMKPVPKGDKCEFVSDLFKPFIGSDEGQTFPIILQKPWSSDEARSFKDLEELKSYLEEIGVEVVSDKAIMTLDIRPDRVMVFASPKGHLRALCG